MLLYISLSMGIFYSSELDQGPCQHAVTCQNLNGYCILTYLGQYRTFFSVWYLCFVHPIFPVFGHFWRWSYENTKILRNLCLHFARQDGQGGKNGKKIMQLKWPKYRKPKDENMGWTKQKFWEQESTGSRFFLKN